jgi:hypothetical protein
MGRPSKTKPVLAQETQRDEIKKRAKCQGHQRS